MKIVGPYMVLYIQTKIKLLLNPSSLPMPYVCPFRSSEHVPAVLTVLLVCMDPLIAGFVLGYSSPASQSLETNNGDGLYLTTEQMTWFGVRCVS